METKALNCDLCGNPTAIRSTIKVGENKGKKVCQYCKPKSTDIPKPAYKLKVHRKKKREGYSEFFDEAISLMMHSPFCDNCGMTINVVYQPHHNIAHILPKQRYKSVATNSHNIVFLCASKDGGPACHERFDNGYTSMMEMPVFALALKKFEFFKKDVTENGKLFHIFAKTFEP